VRSPHEENTPVKYIVEPQNEDRQERNCNKYTTDCALCSEDPRFCGNWE